VKVPTIVQKIALEAVVVLGGALLAAVILRQLPIVKAFIKASWD
jgi:hypothetical protein